VRQIQENVVKFLQKYAMDYQNIDIDTTVNLFLREMQHGLTGRESSLEMIPTYIETDKKVPTNRKVIVMDAGGTNFRVATVYFDEQKKPVVENFSTYPMPGIEKETTSEDFFATIADYIRHIAHKAPNIGFCFSYPTEMFPNKDGRVIRFSKEIKAHQVLGQMIGENLNRALAAAGSAGPKHIVLLNDTVATLLAGHAANRQPFAGYIGFILGTGTNCCYIEKNTNITKNKDLDPAKNQIINCESGGFARCPRGKIDEWFDNDTTNPGRQIFEKMISGAYLGPLCLRVIHTAADDGLFRPSTARLLHNIKDLQTKTISSFLSEPLTGADPLTAACAEINETERVTLYLLIDRLTERAAKLTAVNLSSVAIKSGKGTNPCQPVCIVAEGTTFYHLKNLKPRVEYYLKNYLENQHGIYYEIAAVDNATLLGAAIAGLTN